MKLTSFNRTQNICKLEINDLNHSEDSDQIDNREVFFLPLKDGYARTNSLTLTTCFFC